MYTAKLTGYLTPKIFAEHIKYSDGSTSSDCSISIAMDNGGMHGMNGGYQAGPGAGYGLEQAATNGGGQVEAETNGGGEAGEGAKFSDINLILDQILTMSDQNIDEAQVACTSNCVYSQLKCVCMWSRLGSTPSTATA